jgi:DNA topoisomerase IA
MILIIGEKPSVGKAISSVVGANNTQKGYIEGNGYIVSWCVGHLVGLKFPNDYGNGYGMYIKMKTEPFGGQGYDIRYDKEFHENDPISYIVKFFLRRYDGKDGAWKLLGIEVNEAEGERE